MNGKRNHASEINAKQALPLAVLIFYGSFRIDRCYLAILVRRDKILFQEAVSSPPSHKRADLSGPE
jgi:hypothetical protein